MAAAGVKGGETSAYLIGEKARIAYENKHQWDHQRWRISYRGWQTWPRKAAKIGAAALKKRHHLHQT